MKEYGGFFLPRFQFAKIVDAYQFFSDRGKINWTFHDFGANQLIILLFMPIYFLLWESEL